MFGKKKPVLSCRVSPNEQIIYRDEAKKFPSSRTCCSFDLIIESWRGDDVTGSLAKHRGRNQDVLANQDKKKTKLPWISLFTGSRWINSLTFTRGLIDPVYFSHPILYPLIIISPTLLPDFYNFFLFLSRFLSRISIRFVDLFIRINSQSIF